MAGQDDTIRSFYSTVAKGDTERAIALMEDGIEWFNDQPWDQDSHNAGIRAAN
jgi:hypothetical protein